MNLQKTPLLVLLACLLPMAAQTPAPLVLPLDDFLRQVRSASLDAQMSRYELESAMAGYHELRDSFAPGLSLGAGTAAPASAATLQTNTSFAVGLGKVITESGTSLGLSWSNQYGYSKSGPTAANAWASALSFSIGQPLLRGAPWASTGGYALEAARQSVRLQRSAQNGRVGALLFAALQAYWTFDLDQKLLKIADDSITDARDLLEQNRRRVVLGTVDISDVYRSEVNLTLILNNRDQIYRDLLNIQSQLLFLLRRTNSDPLRVSIQIPQPLVFRDETNRAEQLLELGLKSRKEFEQLRIARELARANLQAAKASLLPRLDASASVSLAGYDATGTGSFSEATGNLGKGATNNVGWSAGLRFEAPLDPGAYKTVIERRASEYRKATENEQSMREQLTMLVHNRLANLRTLKGVLERTQDALEISDKKVAELIRQFKNGRINSTQYIQGYDDLRSIQKLYHQSLYAWEIEKAALRLDLGLFLQGLGIAEVDPAAPVK